MAPDDVTVAQLGPFATEDTLALRRIRDRLGLTQAQMAAQLGVTLSVYCKNEQGMVRVKQPTLRLAQILLDETTRKAARLQGHPTVPPASPGRRGRRGPLSEAARATQRAAHRRRHAPTEETTP